MQKIEHKINLNMSQPNNFEYIHAMQGDYDAEFVIATLYDKNTIYNIDSSTKVILQGATEFDELIVYDNIIINDDRHSVTFPLTKEMLSTSGNISFILSFIDLNTNQKKSAFPFIVKNTKEITASTPVLILQAITDYVNRAEKAAKDAEANKNITDENAAQSKQYLETTKEQADIATTKAQESSSSAVDSANSAIQSSKSATIANEKAEVASTKATEASSSATNAAQSEANAKKSFDEVTRLEQSVIDHKNAVMQSTNNAEESAKKSESWAVGGTSTRDGEDTDNSKYYAEQAKNYADKAQQATVQTVIDSELSKTSTNPVENKVIYQEKIKRMAQNWSGYERYSNLGIGEPDSSTPIGSYLDVETGKVYYGGNSSWSYVYTLSSIYEALDNKVDKSSIANNLVVTEEGYAADARQLNKSVENSFAYEMDKSISAITSRLENSVAITGFNYGTINIEVRHLQGTMALVAAKCFTVVGDTTSGLWFITFLENYKYPVVYEIYKGSALNMTTDIVANDHFKMNFSSSYGGVYASITYLG